MGSLMSKLIAIFLAALFLVAADARRPRPHPIPKRSRTVATTTVKPGPSLDLFNNHYYTCVTNRYVGNFGSGTPSDSNSGTSQSSPWATVLHADSLAAAGWCVIIADGTTTMSSTYTFTHSGSSSTASGYIVYKCLHMDACTFNFPTSPCGSGCAGWDLTGINYIIIDGIKFTASADDSTGYLTGIGAGGPGHGSASDSHHVWVLNSIITGWTGGGIETQGVDFWYIIHNTVSMNAHRDCYNVSGISLYENWQSGLTLTSDDHNNPNGARLGVPSFDIGNGDTFHNVVSWNVLYNNSEYDDSNAACGHYNTDGNGVIFDASTGVGYTGAQLASFNVSYNNGGVCVHPFGSQNIWVVNNSAFNCHLDPNTNPSYDEPTLDDNGASTASYTNHFYNNISVAGTTPNNNSHAIQFWEPTGNNSPTATNNITLLTGAGQEVAMTGATYSSSSNKESTDPLWADVGRTSVGNMITQPNGTNFALCTAAGVPNASCTGASPAIGYGITAPYLPATSVDAGACHHSLTTCP
jgi:hypothetical protein